MRVYHDTCVWFRQFDDHAQPRVAAEAAAFWEIIDGVTEGRLELVTSSALSYEIALHSTPDERETVKLALEMAVEHVPVTDEVVARSNELLTASLRNIDALHVAAAEAGRDDVLVTCDDRFLRRARRCQTSVEILSPIEFAQRMSP